MECTIAALIACFSWSGLYLDGGLRYQDAALYQSHAEHYVETTVTPFLVSTSDRTDSFRRAVGAENPYGEISIGYELNMGSMSWRLQASHISSLSNSGDRGINSLSLTARWFPFR